MAGVTRAAANPKDKQPSTTLPDGGEFARTFLNSGFVLVAS